MTNATHTTTTPSVYVGTYYKYNSGSIQGEWLKLDAYCNKAKFYEACRKLHADERDPEFMFQDFEGFPKSYYGESWIDSELWDWLELSEDEQEIVTAYRDFIDDKATFEEALEALCGVYKDRSDWAYEWLNEMGESVPEHLQGYIDYDAFARDAECGGIRFVEFAWDKCFAFFNV